MAKSRGLRNKNPLNIIKSHTTWIGKAANQTDPKFVVFKTMAYGYRAAWKVMESYRLKFNTQGKLFTVRNIIYRWAPPYDGNDTESYIETVCRLSGVPRNEVLPPPYIDAKKLTKVMQAMTCVENGIKMEDVPMDDLKEGYRLAQ